MFGWITKLIRNRIVEQAVSGPAWAIVGLAGQVVFGARFALQRIASEYGKGPHVPTPFWSISLAGSLALLVYSVHAKNPFFVLGFLLSSLMCVLNLYSLCKRAESVVVTVTKKVKD